MDPKERHPSSGLTPEQVEAGTVRFGTLHMHTDINGMLVVNRTNPDGTVTDLTVDVKVNEWIARIQEQAPEADDPEIEDAMFMVLRPIAWDLLDVIRANQARKARIERLEQAMEAALRIARGEDDDA
jgi:hypothetical protein